MDKLIKNVIDSISELVDFEDIGVTFKEKKQRVLQLINEEGDFGVEEFVSWFDLDEDFE